MRCVTWSIRGAPAGGHTGYERIVVAENTACDGHCDAHDLHHRYSECNDADGALPLDRWCGSFHDGTEEAQERINKRFPEHHEKKAQAWENA